MGSNCVVVLQLMDFFMERSDVTWIYRFYAKQVRWVMLKFNIRYGIKFLTCVHQLTKGGNKIIIYAINIESVSKYFINSLWGYIPESRVLSIKNIKIMMTLPDLC